MRLIDGEALIAWIEGSQQMTSKMKSLICYIKTMPTTDLVRCKECKHNPWNLDTEYTCIWDDDFANREQTPDDFCSYGEREGE